MALNLYLTGHYVQMRKKDKNVFKKLAPNILVFSGSLLVRKMMVPQSNIMWKHEDIRPCTTHW